MPTSERWCSNCGGARVYARGRCRPCYRYRMRHGAERPHALQEELVGRRIDRELEAELLRSASFFVGSAGLPSERVREIVDQAVADSA